jgi:hypothetical protein
MDITKNFMKGSGIGIFIVLVLLLSNALSWGDTRLMIDQSPTTTNGGLNVTVWDGALNSNVPVYLAGTNTLPSLMSCEAPVVDWDSTLNSNSGGWVIFGSDASGNMWTGTVTCASYNPAAAPCTFTPKSGAQPSSCTNPVPSTCLVSSALPPVDTTYPINAQCGGASGQVTSSQPATALCLPGGNLKSLPTAYLTYGWTWQCKGLNGGSDTNCYSYLSGPPANPVNGVCGSDNNGTFSSSPPASGLCSAGTPSSVSGGSSTGKWNWSCYGSNGGTTANCSANYSSVINGACGSDNGQSFPSLSSTDPNLCSPGTVYNFATTSAGWSWYCNGSGGGTNSGLCQATNSGGGGGGAIPITFNAGPNSKLDTLAPGQTKYYYFTVPTTDTHGFSANVSCTAYSNLDIMLEKGTMTNIDTYFAAALLWYQQNNAWNIPKYWYYSDTGLKCWTNIGANTSGEGITLLQSTTDGNQTVAGLPGIYYMIVKNDGSTSATYYVYASQY